MAFELRAAVYVYAGYAMKKAPEEVNDPHRETHIVDLRG